MGDSLAGTMAARRHGHGATMPASSGDFPIEMPLEMQNSACGDY